MKNTAKQLSIILLGVLLLALAVVPASAQGSPVTASVDRMSLSTDEMLTLSVTVDSGAGQSGQPVLPALDGFDVVGTSSGRQLSMVNGATTAQNITQYRLRPMRAGDLAIGPVSVEVGGQTFVTEPIAVTVTQGTGQPQQPSASNQPGLGGLPDLFAPGVDPAALLDQLSQLAEQLPYASAQPLDPGQAPSQLGGQDYFLEATVDNPTPYQGEQVLYTLRFYRTSNPFRQIEYQAPSFTGFWSEQLPDQKEYSMEAAGRTYLVTELQTVLFPTVSGPLTIDPAALVIPSDFLGSRSATLKSEAVTMDVKPLPAGAPDSFQGAVGQFEIASAVSTDKADIQVGDAVTQRIAIRGQGNLETLADPTWPAAAEWRAFDSKSETDAKFADGKFAGTRTYERVLVPTQAGQLTLPAVEFSYFDPAQGTYQTVSGEVSQVNVAPDAAAAAAAPGTTDAAAAKVSALVSSAPAIRPLKPAPATWSKATQSLPQRPGYWLLWGVPLALIAGQTLWQRRLQYAQVNAGALRSQKAAKQAHRALKQARQHQVDPFAAAGRILTEYIGVKLNRSVIGLTQQGVVDALLAAGVDAIVASRVQSILTQSEMGRFAPVGSLPASDDILGQTEQVIDALDLAL